MNRRLLLFGFLVVVSSLVPVWAQSRFNPDEKQKVDIHPTEVIHWNAGAATRLPNGDVSVDLQLTTEMEFTIYTDKLTFKGPGDSVVSNLDAPEPKEQIDPLTGHQTKVYIAGDFKVTFTNVPHDLGEKFEFSLTYLGCTSRICLFPYTQFFYLPLYAQKSALSGGGSPEEATSIDTAEPRSNSSKSETLEETLAARLGSQDTSFWLMMLILFLGGALTNLTPCVAPMLPITVRVLSRQNLSPVLNACVYALGIMLTYTSLSSIAVLSQSAFGTFMSSPLINLAFALVMGILALTMIGFGNLGVLQTIGSRIGAGKPSVTNTLLMGVGAGLVAAPCTGPVLGALLTYAATQQDPTVAVALMATYSFGFSLPYVFLGGAVASIAKMRVSPALQITSKYLFAAVMFALCFYYLRIPLYSLVQQLREHWLAAVYVSLGLSLGVIATGFASRKFMHSKYFAVALCSVLGFCVFATSQWITAPATRASRDGSSTSIHFYKVKAEAFAAAKAQGKSILMDNWAEWCEACKKMDVTTFVDEDVVNELAENWIVLKLDLTLSTDEVEAHLSEYGISGLPTLVLLPPDAETAKADQIIGYVSAAGLLNRLNQFKGK